MGYCEYKCICLNVIGEQGYLIDYLILIADNPLHILYSHLSPLQLLLQALIVGVLFLFFMFRPQAQAETHSKLPGSLGLSPQ